MTPHEQAMVQAKAENDAEQLKYDRLVALRDKHLQQLMEINGKAALAVLTGVLSVMVGASKVQGALIEPTSRRIVIAMTIVAVILLGFGAFYLSSFHTRRIRSIQQRLRKGQLRIRPGEHEVIPRSPDANTCIFVGLLLLAAMALWIFFSVASQAPVPPTTIYTAPMG